MTNKPNVGRHANRAVEERNMRINSNFIMTNIHKPYENYKWRHRYDEGHYEQFDNTYSKTNKHCVWLFKQIQLLLINTLIIILMYNLNTLKITASNITWTQLSLPYLKSVMQIYDVIAISEHKLFNCQIS